MALYQVEFRYDACFSCSGNKSSVWLDAQPNYNLVFQWLVKLQFSTKSTDSECVKHNECYVELMLHHLYYIKFSRLKNVTRKSLSMNLLILYDTFLFNEKKMTWTFLSPYFLQIIYWQYKTNIMTPQIACTPNISLYKRD